MQEKDPKEMSYIEALTKLHSEKEAERNQVRGQPDEKKQEPASVDDVRTLPNSEGEA